LVFLGPDTRSPGLTSAGEGEIGVMNSERWQERDAGLWANSRMVTAHSDRKTSSSYLRIKKLGASSRAVAARSPGLCSADFRQHRATRMQHVGWRFLVVGEIAALFARARGRQYSIREERDKPSARQNRVVLPARVEQTGSWIQRPARHALQIQPLQTEPGLWQGHPLASCNRRGQLCGNVINEVVLGAQNAGLDQTGGSISGGRTM
jgi:hypothetical protein